MNLGKRHELWITYDLNFWIIAPQNFQENKHNFLLVNCNLKRPENAFWPRFKSYFRDNVTLSWVSHTYMGKSHFYGYVTLLWICHTVVIAEFVFICWVMYKNMRFVTCRTRAQLGVANRGQNIKIPAKNLTYLRSSVIRLIWFCMHLRARVVLGTFCSLHKKESKYQETS